MDIDVEVDVDINRYFGCLKGVSKPAQVLFNVLQAVMLLTLRYHVPVAIYYMLYTIYHLLDVSIY